MRDVAEPGWSGRLRISETTPSIRILRLWRPDQATLRRLEAVLGAPLPTTPNTTAGGASRLLWMGPGEWAIVGGDAALDHQLPAACGEALHHLADVTDGRVVLLVEGDNAPDLMAKGCSLDFHPRAFAAGTCAQSLFAQLRVLIERPSDAPAFRVIVDRTFLAHLRAWLHSAGAEFLDPAE